MKENKEIAALFTLIDDPDEEVFSTVSDRIVNYGKSILPYLENLWENTSNEDVQERIEFLIHNLYYSDLSEEVRQWNNSTDHDLLTGVLLAAKFQYPELQTTLVLQEIEKIRRNVWLELNSFLTPLEQAHVITSILYNYYNLKGLETTYTNPDDFLIHKVLQGKKGNSLSNGILYLVLAELLEIPVKAISIPKQFVLAFFSEDFNEETYKGNPQNKILFYVDATTGQPFSHNDVDAYFKRMDLPATPSCFKPLDHRKIVRLLFKELAKCFNTPAKIYKQRELLDLSDLLEN